MLAGFTGYAKESSELAQQIIDALSLPSRISEKWQHLTIDRLIGFKKLNPFVLYPFFIYYEKVPKN